MTEGRPLFRDGMDVVEKSKDHWHVTCKLGNTMEVWGPYGTGYTRSLVSRDDWDRRRSLRSQADAQVRDQLQQAEGLLIRLDEKVARIAAERDSARYQRDDVIERAKTVYTQLTQRTHAVNDLAIALATARAVAQAYRNVCNDPDTYVQLPWEDDDWRTK